MEQLTKIYDTSPEICVPGAVPGVAFKSINSVLCLSSEFEDRTFFIADYSKILCANGQKNIMHYKLLHLVQHQSKQPPNVLQFSHRVR